MREKVKQAQDLLEQIRAKSEVLESISNKNAAHVELWQEAVRMGDGVVEHAERELIHSLLDQSLDTRAEVLQLVKKFQLL